MARKITLAEFRRLTHNDFQNGATRDAIADALKDRDAYLAALNVVATGIGRDKKNNTCWIACGGAAVHVVEDALAGKHEDAKAGKSVLRCSKCGQPCFGGICAKCKGERL